MEKSTWTLSEKAQARAAFNAAYERGMAHVLQGGRAVLELRPERRSDVQNRLLHALIGDVSRQKEWGGKKLQPDAWKVLFVSGHAVATREGVEIVPGIEFEYVNIRESTAKMTKARLSSLIEYIYAWGSANSVAWSSDSMQWRDGV